MQPCKTGDQLYSDASPYSECSLVYCFVCLDLIKLTDVNRLAVSQGVHSWRSYKCLERSSNRFIVDHLFLPSSASSLIGNFV